MKYIVLKMFINGIKSIDNEIRLDFSNDNLFKDINDKYSKVKAIYGSNGAGKTGIIYAVDIYKSLMLNSNYLRLNDVNDVLGNVINQKTKKFNIRMIFASLDDNNKIINIFSHYIEIVCVGSKYVISEEIFSKLTGYRLKNKEKYKTIFHIKNGEFISEFSSKEEKDFLCSKTANLLQQQSMFSIFIDIIDSLSNENNDLNLINSGFLDNLLELFKFIFSIKVVMQNIDKNYIDIDYVVDQMDVINSLKERIDSDMFTSLLVNRGINQKDIIRVPRISFDKFQEYVKRLCKFIQVFKEELDTIDIKVLENRDILECDLILIYNDGTRVSKAYESTGIKKIIELYTFLSKADEGNIVFIDEFDANIHDVLLIKLVEYFVNYSNGQLIFTTHNVGPMEVLKKEKFSIDFLSSNSKITSWKSKGNSTPDSLYRKGLIENSPFNIEGFSFLGVFGED